MSAELNKAHTHHTELQSCRKDPGFTFCLTEIEVLMCSFVANKFSDSVAQETKSFPGLQLITDRWRLFMLLCCWMCGLGTTVLPAVLCSYRHQGCLFLFEIIISGGSWRPQCLQSHRHLCTGQCISLCSSFPPVSTYSAHPSHHWFHSNCGLLLGCQRPKQQ